MNMHPATKSIEARNPLIRDSDEPTIPILLMKTRLDSFFRISLLNTLPDRDELLQLHRACEYTC